MKLRDLEAAFIKITERGYRTDATFADCDGLIFLCPKCFADNNGPVGTHCVICWKSKIPADVFSGPGRWDRRGTGIDDLTLYAGSSSIQLTGSCNWHGFVGNGGVPPGEAA
jgi:hypothetical protein